MIFETLCKIQHKNSQFNALIEKYDKTNIDA